MTEAQTKAIDAFLAARAAYFETGSVAGVRAGAAALESLGITPEEASDVAWARLLATT